VRPISEKSATHKLRNLDAKLFRGQRTLFFNTDRSPVVRDLWQSASGMAARRQRLTIRPTRTPVEHHCKEGGHQSWCASTAWARMKPSEATLFPACGFWLPASTFCPGCCTTPLLFCCSVALLLCCSVALLICFFGSEPFEINDLEHLYLAEKFERYQSSCSLAHEVTLLQLRAQTSFINRCDCIYLCITGEAGDKIDAIASKICSYAYSS
jgi:hypothetical protein